MEIPFAQLKFNKTSRYDKDTEMNKKRSTQNNVGTSFKTESMQRTEPREGITRHNTSQSLM